MEDYDTMMMDSEAIGPSVKISQVGPMRGKGSPAI